MKGGTNLIDRNRFKLIYNPHKKYVNILINDKYSVPIRADEAFEIQWAGSDSGERRVIAQKLCLHAANIISAPAAIRNEVFIGYAK